MYVSWQKILQNWFINELYDHILWQTIFKFQHKVLKKDYFQDMYKHLAQPNNHTFFLPTSLTASLNKQIY